jgi:phosphatidylethanolamine/phosphatidyl-N-methylethanolamine N-methyltransferase
MLARARKRLTRAGARHVRLCRMDAGRLAFPDGCFDAVSAPYVLNVVPDPVGVAREIIRVCSPGGRIVLLNHFDHADESSVNRLIGRLAVRITRVDWHLNLNDFLDATGLIPSSIDRVNIPRVSSVVVCRAR